MWIYIAIITITVKLAGSDCSVPILKATQSRKEIENIISEYPAKRVFENASGPDRIELNVANIKIDSVWYGPRIIDFEAMEQEIKK